MTLNKAYLIILASFVVLIGGAMVVNVVVGATGIPKEVGYQMI